MEKLFTMEETVEDVMEDVMEPLNVDELEAELEAGTEMEALEEAEYDQSSVGAYLKEISQYPVLTPEEEIELALRMEQGDVSAKERFYAGNLRLVVSIAKRYCNHGMEFLDLIQEGNIGLMKAVNKFDVHMGYKFSTYATWWIRQGISRALSEQSSTIRKPVHAKEEIYRMNRIYKQLLVEGSGEPSEEEIANAMGVPVERIRELREYGQETISLQAPVGEGRDASSLGDFLQDDKTQSPEAAAFEVMLKKDIRQVLMSLSERERQVLVLRYGLNGDSPQTLEEVGKRYGLTRERIRQIELQALRKMRSSKNSKRLQEYLIA